MPIDRTPAEPDIPPELDRSPGDDRPARRGGADGGRGADAAGGTELSVAGLRLDGWRSPGATWRGATFVDPSLRDVVMRDANLANMTFHGGLLWRARIDRGRLTGSAVTESELRDVTIHDASASMAGFRHATLTRVTFDGCILQQADFMGARAEDVRFHGCDLTGANFAHAELDGAEFRRCMMDEIEGVDGLRGAAMELEQVGPGAGDGRRARDPAAAASMIAAWSTGIRRTTRDAILTFLAAVRPRPAGEAGRVHTDRRDAVRFGHRLGARCRRGRHPRRLRRGRRRADRGDPP